MTTTEIFHTGDGQVVRLPQGFEFTASEVAIRRDGEAVILEPIRNDGWPADFFEKVLVDDPSFVRPQQGQMPVVPPLDAT